ncbi:MAG: hypothetical protein GXO91_04465 [FCB group bacterium]|nr:hypothetical protein [FCB group bacterium]
MKYTLILTLVSMVFLAGQQDFDEWMKKEQQKYQRYVDTFDAEFADFLNRDWKEFQSFNGLTRDETPKPVAAPVAKIAPPPPPGPPVELPAPPPAVPDTLPEIVEPERPAEEKYPVDVDFFGVPLVLDSGMVFDISLKTPIDNHVLSDFWLELAKRDFKPLLAQLESLRGRLSLNDWAFGRLVKTTAERMTGSVSAKSDLLTWYLLVKAGYDVKVGYLADRVVLLTPTTRMIYETPYFEIDGRRYFTDIFNKKTDKPLKLKTYSGNYPEADRPIAVGLPTLPVLGGRYVEREYPFSYQAVEYRPVLEYDAGLLDFFNAYPQTELEVYFAASPSPVVRKSFYESFTPLVDGKSQGEALDLILRFVQTAFSYETDGDQFGYEKPLFPDETLYYPFCDCEDRAVLFALMTGELLGLETVGLRYPGHVAVGVRWGTAYEGDHLKVAGQDFLICDPTYINAGIGMSMPQFKGVTPEIIRF